MTDETPQPAYEENDVQGQARSDDLTGLIRSIIAAAGDLDGLPDSHAFQLGWHDDDHHDADGDVHGVDRPRLITAGQIRRAAAVIGGAA